MDARVGTAHDNRDLYSVLDRPSSPSAYTNPLAVLYFVLEPQGHVSLLPTLPEIAHWTDIPFIKKTQKTPPAEIELALKRKKEIT